MKKTSHIVITCVLLGLAGIASAKSPECSVPAIAQARKLLSFHADGDDRIAIDDKVKELPSLKNPADTQQRFQVLEVWGYIYKARYRMRLIYAPMGGSCTLMGQEVLEFAKL
ncbi:MAG: hypothetical protein A2Z93_02215 [Curvibacter sp. GWA2_64_110]|nr:MAG: hypothetical protein A2Z93_02215 [Curvibacter sp. GWA2_64_110]HCY16561.1 hypothetical protein [Curvibacter sp.]